MSTLLRKNKTVPVVLVLVLSTIFLFNNCGQEVEFAESMASITGRLNSNEIYINKNAEFTNKSKVEVSVLGDETKEIYVTNDPQCLTGGVWEPYVSVKDWELTALNSEARVFAKFRDFDSIESECKADSIIHDDKPPIVSFNNRPSVATKSSSANFLVVASDEGSGADELVCQRPGEQSYSSCGQRIDLLGLKEGPQQIVVKAKDRAGNWSQGVSHYWVVDQTAPTIEFNQTPQGITSNSQAKFEFTANDELTGVKKYVCLVDGAPSVSCESGMTLAVQEGNHRLSVKAIDFAGNESPEISYSWKVDTTAPSIELTKTPDGISNLTQAQFEFVGEDDGLPISKFSCSIDNGAFVECTSPHSIPNLKDGNHIFRLKGLDGAGNWSAEVSYSWVIDTGKPIIDFVRKPDRYTKEIFANFLIGASDNGSGIKDIICLIDGELEVSCKEGLLRSDLSQGNHNFRAWAIDQAGNRSEDLVYNWMVDTGAPVVTIVSSPPDYIKVKMYEVAFSASDDLSGVAGVRCELNGLPDNVCPEITCDGSTTCSGSFLLNNLEEGVNVIRVVAMDRADNSGDSAKNLSVDLSGPIINFVQSPPATLEYGGVARIEVEVTDLGSGVASTSCQLDGQSIQCPMGTVFEQAQVVSGSHTFMVLATDNVGFTSEKSVSWTVASGLFTNTQSVSVLPGNNMVDILFVVDNSGSMSEEQKNLADRVSNFISQIQGLDWQIGVTTTDARDTVINGDGKLRSFSDGTKVLKSQTYSPEEAQAILGQNIQMGTGGSGTEQGIRAANRAVTRALEGTVANRELIRDAAALAVIVISDENESRSESINMPDTLINLVKANWASKAFNFHSIIKIPGDSSCNTAWTYGYRYEELSQLTGGIVASICLSDYGTALNNIGGGVQELVKSVNLDCEPQDTNSDGQPDIGITLEGGGQAPSFTVSGRLVTFSEALPVGTHELSYSCLAQ